MNKKSAQRNSPIVRRIFLNFLATVLCSFIIVQCKPPIDQDKIVLVMPEAITGEQYIYEFNIQELDSNCVICASSDNLPRGLYLDQFMGIVHGIPEESGTFYLEVTMLDTISNSESEPSLIKLKVNLPEGISSPHQFYIATNSPLPAAYSGENYYVRLTTRNNIGEIKWDCDPLPSGLHFNAESGSIEGIPIPEGLFCINVSAQDTKDSTRNDSKTFALQILNPKNKNNQSSSDPNSPRKLDDMIAKLECGQILFTAPSEMKQYEEREVTLLISLDKIESDLKSKIINATDLPEALSDLEEKNIDVDKIEESINKIEEEIVNSKESDSEHIKEQISDIEEEVKELKNDNVSTEELESAIDKLKKITISGRLLSEEVRLSSRMSAKLEGSGFEIEGPNNEIKGVGARTITEWKWIIKALKSRKQEITLTLYAHINIDNTLSPYEIEVFKQNIEVKVSILGSIADIHKKYWEFIWSVILIPIIIWGFNKFRKRRTQS